MIVFCYKHKFYFIEHLNKIFIHTNKKNKKLNAIRIILFSFVLIVFSSTVKLQAYSQIEKQERPGLTKKKKKYQQQNDEETEEYIEKDDDDEEDEKNEDKDGEDNKDSRDSDEVLILDSEIKINGILKGTTHIAINLLDEQSVCIDPTPINELLKKYMNPEYYRECSRHLVSSEKFITTFKLENGFHVQYNSDDQVVEVCIPPLFLQINTLSICGRPDETDPDDLIPPAPSSWYINFYVDKYMEFLKNSRFCLKSSPTAFCLDYCYHKGMWTLEGSFDFGTRYYRQQLLSTVVLTRDIPEKKLRICFGNVEPQAIGIQRSLGLIGVSVDYNPTYFDGLARDENNNRVDFFLTKISRVEIYVNGMAYKILRLPPGPHRVEDFPSIMGTNEISIRIHNDIDEVEVLNSTYTYNPSMIKKGLFAYSMGVGFPSPWSLCWGQGRSLGNSYYWKLPVFSGSWIYGLSTYMSAGSFFQISPKNLQIGSESIVLTSRLRMRAGCGLFWEIQNRFNMQYYFTCDNSIYQSENILRWNANIQYFGRPTYYDCNLSKQNQYSDHYVDAARLIGSFNVSRRIWNSYFVSAGCSSSFTQNWKMQYGVSASISRNYNQYLSASLSGYATFHSPTKNTHGIVFTITTTSPNSSIYNNSSYLSERGSFYNQTTWNKNLKENTNLNASCGLEESPRQEAGNMDIFLNHNRFTASAMANTTKLKRDRHGEDSIYNGFANFSFATCLLYADGCCAISRPNYDSFIIVKPKPEITSNGIQVNNHSYSSWGKLPAVLDNQSSYDTICLDVFSDALPIGYDFGENHFCCKTEYKSGTAIIVGEGRSYLLTGTLVDADNNPLKCLFGYAERSLDTNENKEKIEFFTNRSGAFQIASILPGAYTVHIIGQEGSAEFKFADNESGFVELGTLMYCRKKEIRDPSCIP